MNKVLVQTNKVSSVVNSVEPITMSSLEIIEYINMERGYAEGIKQLRHSDFLEKVLVVLGEEFSGKFRSTYTASNGKENPCYIFPKREACLMAMSYSYDLQAKIYDKMTDLELQAVEQTFNLPTTYIGALEELLVSKKSEDALLELTHQQETQIELQAPAVAFVEKFVQSQGLSGIREVAKVFGIKQNMFVEILIKEGLLFRENGKLQAYSKFVDIGYFVVKFYQSEHNQAHPNTKFTPKGVRWVAKRLKLDVLFGDTPILV